MNKVVLIPALALSLASCTLMPSYLRPDFSAAQTWADIPEAPLDQQEQKVADLSWQNFFKSPELSKIIELALENNKDLKTAALNIEQARATYRIERADLMPALNAVGSGTKQKNSSAVSGMSIGGTDYERYQANLSVAAYELDLFGKIRSNKKSALNAYLATEQAAAAVRNSLIAEVANAYLQLLTDQKLLSLTQKTLKAQEETYTLLSESLDKGSSTKQDVARAQTSVETARVNFYQYTRYVEQDKNALFLLLSMPNNESILPETTTLDNIQLEENLSVGIPSEVLLERPDVKQAEFELMARNADIGAARAAFFPSISLTGTYGFASNQLNELFMDGTGGAWAFMPSITLPIFQGGRNKANLDIAKLRKEQAVLAYETSIQTAFKEVADELAARQTLDKQLKAQRNLVSAAQEVYDISNARYEAGIDSFLDVLDAQRELYSYQQTEIQTQRQRLANYVNLYKALGGGAYNNEAQK